MIQIKEVSKSFKGNAAIQNLNLSVKKGEILGLLGANGAGKSTTINMLLGFIQPDSGAININELDVSTQANEKMYGAHMGKSRNQLPGLSGVSGANSNCNRFSNKNDGT